MAMRSPISGVRSVTVYASRPYRPIAASSNASAPKPAMRYASNRCGVSVAVTCSSMRPDGINGHVLVERGHLAPQGGDERAGRYATRGRAAPCSTGTAERAADRASARAPRTELRPLMSRTTPMISAAPAVDGHALAERALIRPQDPRERLVEHRDARRLLIVAVGEAAAGDQRDVQGIEVPR